MLSILLEASVPRKMKMAKRGLDKRSRLMFLYRMLKTKLAYHQSKRKHPVGNLARFDFYHHQSEQAAVAHAL
jgi:hypothetical protein